MKYFPIFGVILSVTILIMNVWVDFKLYMPIVVANIVIAFFTITLISLMIHSYFVANPKK